MSSNQCCARCNNVLSSSAWGNILSLGKERHPSTWSFSLGDVADFKAHKDCACCQSLTAALSLFPGPLSGFIVLELVHIGKEHTGLGANQHSGRCLRFFFLPGTTHGPSRSLLPTVEGNEQFRPSWTGPWARQIKPLEVRIDLVRSWLLECETHHHIACQSSMIEEAEPVQTMFIDVVQECLVHGGLHGTDYVALSYVWGQVPSLKTTKEHLPEFHKPGNISTSRRDIPKTIRDTMELARSLGLRYLWVDTLCIVQDDNDTVQRNLDNMALIYANSFLTVIAAHGSDAESGLRPSKPDMPQLPVLHFPHISLRLQPAAGKVGDITQAKWSSRAWTFQEALFSRRCLVFGQQTSWYCRTVTFEESEMEPSRNPAALDPELQEEVRLGLVLQYQVPDLPPHFCFDAKSRFPPAPDAGMWRTLRRIIEAYNRRHLSFDTDITRAIAGTMALFTTITKETLYYGLPMTIFGIAMLWPPTSMPRRRGAAAPAHANSPDYLPSWSWIGWQADLDLRCWDALTREEHYNVSLVDWHNRQDCFMSVVGNQVVSAKNTARNCICRRPPLLQSQISGSLLYFCCQRSFFRFKNIQSGPCLSKYLLLGSDVLVGFLTLHDFSTFDQTQTVENQTVENDLPKQVELLCISCGRFSPHDKNWDLIAPVVADDFYSCRYRLSQFDKVEYEFCNVLAIRREGEIALRIGVGRVEKHAWNMARTETIDVILA